MSSRKRGSLQTQESGTVPAQGRDKFETVPQQRCTALQGLRVVTHPRHACGDALHPISYAKLPCDWFNAYTPLSLIGPSPNMLLVRADSPIRTLADLIAAERERPGQISFGHAGNGPSPHLAGELLKYMAK